MIKKSIEKFEEILVDNIATAIIHFEFADKATDKEYKKYYGGRDVLREAEKEFAKKSLMESRVQLEFIRKHKEYLIKTYGDKNKDRNIKRIEKYTSNKPSSDRGNKDDVKGKK